MARSETWRLGPESVLDALNFALAGAREGFGPFLGVYLQSRGFDPATTGGLMSIAGAAGLVATTPAGVLIDGTEHKRAALALSVTLIGLGAVVIVATGSPWAIAAGQATIGVGDTCVAPLVAAITLGTVGLGRFGARMARNDALNHLGNAVLSAFAALLGYTLGLGYVALSIVVMAVLSVLVLRCMDPAIIDHAIARGGRSDGRSALAIFVRTPRLVALAAIVLLFQTADGAITPFLAQARVAAGANASLVTGVMIVTARLTMVAAALGVPHLARWRGYRAVMALSLATVVVRAALAVFSASWGLILVIQALDGLALGLAGVAIPALSAGIMEGTGRATAGFAATMTAFGLGATLSPLVAGLAAERFGYAGGFYALAGIAAIGVAGWMVGGRSDPQARGDIASASR